VNAELKAAKTARAQVTLSDVYRGRELTDAQVRRLIALLGLTRPKSPDAEPRPSAA
jgi:hypothetical protein